MISLAERTGFVRTHTRLQSPPSTPELRLYLADEITPIWRMTEAALEAVNLAPPFWAFAWAGGQALARWLLDHPEAVAGRRVLDLATGSGLAAIAAARAGATQVTAADIDPFCAAAVALNAEANGVEVAFTHEDLLAAPPPDVDLVLCADAFYEAPLARAVRGWLAAARRAGARVLLADPGRSYFRSEGLTRLARYEVITTRELEDADVKPASVWEVD